MATADTGATPANTRPLDPGTGAAGYPSDRARASIGAAGEEGATGQGSESETPAEALEVGDLIFEVEKSMRYHQRRRAHFERWHRWSMLVVIIFGSAAAARLRSGEVFFGLAAAFVGALDLVYSPSVRAIEHSRLHQRFTELAICICVSQNPSAAQLRKWQADRLLIEADEPPTFWALEADCFNEAARALGRRKERLNKVAWWRRSLKHMVRFEGRNFQEAG